MSVGIPSRRLGIEMGQQFLKQTQGGSYRNFVEWQSSLEGETLRENYKLDALSLQEITRSVSRVSGNPLLDNFAGLESMMPIATQIAGIRHGQRSEVAKRANIGDELKLRRDLDNAVDRNAVAVYLAGDEVGYLPRFVAQLLAPEMDSGRAFKAGVTEIRRRRIPIIHISISL